MTENKVPDDTALVRLHNFQVISDLVVRYLSLKLPLYYFCKKHPEMTTLVPRFT